ncbi:MAG: cell division protein ZapE [Cocleimonas sp.]
MYRNIICPTLELLRYWKIIVALSGFEIKENSPLGAKNNLINAYLLSISDGELRHDPAQEHVMHELQLIYDEVLQQESRTAPKKSIFSFFSDRSKKQPTHIIKGLYLFGGVGRGKTHLVDFFFEQLPVKKKMRLHFHRFMHIVHEELAKLDGVENPLKQVARIFSDKAQILCFDEFHVIDITDAMLLGKLLEHLFENGLVLVTTSNFHPDDLYRNGLQRDRFIPAINLLKKHTKLVEMGGDYDYRSEAFKELGIYYFINDDKSEDRLEHHFKQLSGIELYEGRQDIIINKRLIPVKKFTPNIVWFEFDDLCNTARSTEDFTEIASFFKTVLIANIPKMDSSLDDAARRFINMIDTFYDMHVNIVVSAAAAPEEIYSGKKLSFEFDRAVSRINEMQTNKYIESIHQLRNTSDKK